jgi:hypothetical protein
MSHMKGRVTLLLKQLKVMHHVSVIPHLYSSIHCRRDNITDLLDVFCLRCYYLVSLYCIHPALPRSLLNVQRNE